MKKNPVAQKLDVIMNRVGMPYFVMATSHLFDVGYKHLTEDNVKYTIESINKHDDTDEIMTNGFKIMLVETAYEISKTATPLQLAKYISKFVQY